MPNLSSKAALFLLAALCAAPASAHAFWDPVTALCRPPDLEGRASAIDGDTLELSSPGDVHTVIRLIGVEAPELFQECRDADGPWSCGRAARQALEELVGGRTLACSPCGMAPDGTLEATCRADGLDIGAEMLRTGLATTDAFFSNAMHSAEVSARRAGRGLWRGDWVHPRAWRDGMRLGEEPCRGCSLPQ